MTAATDITWPTDEGRTVTVFSGIGHDDKPRWYFHVKAANGRVVTTGGQGYRTRRSAIRAARRMFPEES